VGHGVAVAPGARASSHQGSMDHRAVRRGSTKESCTRGAKSGSGAVPVLAGSRQPAAQAHWDPDRLESMKALF